MVGYLLLLVRYCWVIGVVVCCSLVVGVLVWKVVLGGWCGGMLWLGS